YYVVYENGYESYSPGDAFEDGYSRIHVKRTEFLTKKDVAPKKVFIDDLEKVSAGFKPFDGQQATLIHELSDAISKVGVTYDGEQLIACIELILGKLKNIERGER
ncbi:MAG: hypothetical protein JNL32_16465, partial [Candidatus Kapabacteria bacterium]|nr:hypothetical protein [Candidatus Kapabacteria bacterium]